MIQKLKKLAVFLSLLSLPFTSNAANAVASWSPSPESSVTSYQVIVAGNGATNKLTVNVPTTSVEIQNLAVGVPYLISLSALNNVFLQSTPVSLNFTPSLGTPPEVPITSHSIDSYANGYWYGIKVNWDPVDKLTYGYTNYTFLVDNLTKATRTPIQTSTNTYSFTQLPRATYRFSVVITNAFGVSPLNTNTSWVLDGTVPATLVNAKIVPIAP